MEKLKEFIKKQIKNDIESVQAHLRYYEEEYQEEDYDHYFESFGWFSAFDTSI